MGDDKLFARALPYYVSAIASVLIRHDQKRDGAATLETIHSHWSYRHDEQTEYVLEDPGLLHAAIAECRDWELIENLDDEFGPPLLRKSDEFDKSYIRLKVRYADVFNKHEIGGDAWLRIAIFNINRERLKADSVANQDDEIKWEPLPIDRADTKLQEATGKLDEAIEAIRGDNGYNATHPEESGYVVDGLRVLARRLKESAQIAWIFVDEGLQRLSLVVNRLGEAASGIAAAAAKAALTDWLKALGLEWLKSLLK